MDIAIKVGYFIHLEVLTPQETKQVEQFLNHIMLAAFHQSIMFVIAANHMKSFGNTMRFVIMMNSQNSHFQIHYGRTKSVFCTFTHTDVIFLKNPSELFFYNHILENASPSGVSGLKKLKCIPLHCLDAYTIFSFGANLVTLR